MKVTEPIAFKYRAFISYSHRDDAWAKWLHSGLEHYRIDKDLVGQETPVGPVPKSRRPATCTLTHELRTVLGIVVTSMLLSIGPAPSRCCTLTLRAPYYRPTPCAGGGVALPAALLLPGAECSACLCIGGTTLACRVSSNRCCLVAGGAQTMWLPLPLLPTSCGRR